MYHEGNRALQDAFGSRALADRLDEKLRRDRFTDDDAAFIAALGFFFLATADAQGGRTARSRAGRRGSRAWRRPDLLVFPDYDGNGMFKSLGNLRRQSARGPAVHRHGRGAQAAAGERNGAGGGGRSR